MREHDDVVADVLEALTSIKEAAAAIEERVHLFGPEIHPLLALYDAAIFLKRQEKRVREAENLEHTFTIGE